MKPLKSALFIAGVFLMLMLTFFFMPEEGLSVSRIHLRNPLPAGEVRSSVAALFAQRSSPPRHVPERQWVRADTSVAVPAGGRKKTEAAAPLTFSDSLLRAVPSIEMSDTTRLLLYHLLREMDSLRARRRRLHILYYGDSQIEGDRITLLLRDTLQARFGGGGPGFLLPVMTVPFTASFVTEPSAGWRRVNNYSVRGGSRQGIPFGLAGAYSLAEGDSAGRRKERSVHCRIAVHKFAPHRIRTFSRLELWLYARQEAPAVKITRDGTVREYPSLPGGELVRVRVPLEGEGRKVRLDFGLRGPFAVEGIFLEDPVGVSVDNIPLRGRPFMMFSRCDAATMKIMFDSLNVRMVVLQFGLNVAVGSMRDVRVYRHTMQRELRWLRKTFPGVFVLVVGVTDMGGDDPALQERLQRIREEQRQTAVAEGCAFWDAYLAMGGEKAMARWAAQQPSLARPDQAHMSLEGSQLFARMLLKALMEDYQTYTHGL